MSRLTAGTRPGGASFAAAFMPGAVEHAEAHSITATDARIGFRQEREALIVHHFGKYCRVRPNLSWRVAIRIPDDSRM
jgi:hypothetical protein